MLIQTHIPPVITFSDDLEDSLEPLERLGITFSNEQAVELFYNYAITPWFILGADLQYVKPARSEEDTFSILVDNYSSLASNKTFGQISLSL